MKKWLLALAVLVFAIFISGCNAEDSSIVDEIKERGTIIIATSGDNKPTIFPDENNELVGLDADWAKEVADYLGVEIEWARMEFKGIVPSLTSGKADIGMSGMWVTEQRKEVVDYSNHYAFEEVVAVFPETITDIKSPEDIEGKVVGVVAGSQNGEIPVREIGGYEEIKLYPGVAMAFEDLKTGRLDVVVTGNLVSGHWVQTEGEGFKISENGISETEIAIATNKGNEELIEVINEAINKGKEEGKYKDYALKWVGQEFSE